VAAEGLDWLQVSQRAWSWAACSLHRATTMGRIQIILMNTRRDMEARSVTARLDGGDGRKALFLRNHGDEKFPNLRAEKVFEDENPPTHEQGSERAAEALSNRPIGTTSRSIASHDRSLRPWSR